jgi:hypothetical protein
MAAHKYIIPFWPVIIDFLAGQRSGSKPDGGFHTTYLWKMSIPASFLGLHVEYIAFPRDCITKDH